MLISYGLTIEEWLSSVSYISLSDFVVLHCTTGEGNGTPLQYSCLKNPMDGGAWWAAVHGVAKSQTRLSDFTFTFHFHALEKEMTTLSSVLSWRIPGMGSLVGCRLWGRTELDSTERLHFHFSLSCIGEGNGSPLQYSILEDPRDGEPGGLLSMGSHRVGHDWSDLAAAATALLWEFSSSLFVFPLFLINSVD